MCQQRKARCELPDLDVPSGPLPLPDHQSCHRCRTLQISCIVDDANKKKPKKTAAEPGATAPDTTTRRASTSAPKDLRGLRKSSTNASFSSSLADTLSLNSNASTASLPPSGAEQGDANDLKYAGGRVLGDQIVYPAEAKLVSKTPDSSSDEDSDSPSPAPSGQTHQRNPRPPSASSEAHIKTQERNPRDVANIDVWERFSTRSRPLTLLTELVPRQNGFASKVFRLVSARATIETDVTEIISDQKSKQLADWCENNLAIWIPHLRNAYQIRQEALQGKQTLSTQLLEQVLYLIAMQHIRDPRDDVMRFSITRFVIRDLARLMITTPRSAEAVQALELLALFPVDVSAIPGPSRNRIRTDSLINAAERYARSVRLDRVALTSAAPYSFVISNNQLDDFDTKRTAMSWASVKTWYNTFTLGDDELYESIDVRFFCDDWSRSLVLPSETEPSNQSQPHSNIPEAELFPQRRWSHKRRIGSIGLAMRCLVMRQLLVAFEAIRNTRIDLPESERLATLSGILDKYGHHVEGVDEEFQQRLVDNKGEGELLRIWLTIEATAGYLLILGAGILRGLGIDKKEDVPSHELAFLIRGENASPGMRDFLTKYGEHRILAAEKVLVNVSTLCRDARRAGMATSSGKGSKVPDVSQGLWMVEGQSRAVLPLNNVCGYALEAAFNAMEMHATMFKLWKSPPKRSESWQIVFSNVVTAMLSLDPNGSIRNGSIPATCAYILQGMLKVIATWTDCSRKKDHHRSASSSSVAALNFGPGCQDGGSGSGWEHGASSHQSQQARPPVGGANDLERSSALPSDDLTARKGYDVAQGVGAGLTSSSRFSDPSAFRAGQVGPNGNASSYSMAPAMFGPDVAAFSQYSNLRGGPTSQGFAPDATESLAAALPHSGSWASESTYAPSHPQHQATNNYFGPYRAAHPTSLASGSSNASSHTHTPPSMYESGANGARILSGGTTESTFGLEVNNPMRINGDSQSTAFDSLDFILNDVLGSSEWSGILQDIWRTEI